MVHRGIKNVSWYIKKFIYDDNFTEKERESMGGADSKIFRERRYGISV